MNVYLSPSNQTGHGYPYGGTNECEQCNRIAHFAEQALSRCGFTVRKAPMGQGLRSSIQESNSWEADLHLCIHTNTGGGAGTAVFIRTLSPNGLAVASPIYRQVQGITPGEHEYGIQENPSLVELHCVKAPAVFLECEFHDREDLAKWIVEHAQQLGEAICRGVCDAFAQPYIAPSSLPVFPIPAGSFGKWQNAQDFCRLLQKAGFVAVVQTRKQTGAF